MNEIIKKLQAWCNQTQPQIKLERKNKKRNVLRQSDQNQESEKQYKKRIKRQNAQFIRQKKVFVFYYNKALQHFRTTQKNNKQATDKSLISALKQFQGHQQKCTANNQQYTMKSIKKRFRPQFLFLFKTLPTYNSHQIAEFSQKQIICTNISKIQQNKKNPQYKINHNGYLQNIINLNEQFKDNQPILQQQQQGEALLEQESSFLVRIRSSTMKNALQSYIFMMILFPLVLGTIGAQFTNAQINNNKQMQQIQNFYQQLLLLKTSISLDSNFEKISTPILRMISQLESIQISKQYTVQKLITLMNLQRSYTQQIFINYQLKIISQKLKAFGIK